MKKKLNLTAYIFIGMILGVVVGLIFHQNPTFTSEYLKPIGNIYIHLLKFMMVPVVLLSIISGVISLKDIKKVGSIGLKASIYYILSTVITNL